MNTLYSQIIEASKEVDQTFDHITEKELLSFVLKFTVPASHSRSKSISHYSLKVEEVDFELFNSALVVVDNGVVDTFVSRFLTSALNIVKINSNESTYKEKAYFDANVLDRISGEPISKVVAVGGGLTLNISAYLASRLNASLILVPTSVISMADGSGGKVRMNKIDGQGHHKHFYKDFYEPNRIVIAPKFLESLSADQIKIGLGEIIKHGVFQSEALLEFVASPGFDPINNKQSLLKAVLWTAALKRVCLKLDPEESPEGSEIILRGAHKASDMLEEASKFSLPHGLAVAIALYEEVKNKHPEKFGVVDFIYNRFELPKHFNR